MNGLDLSSVSVLTEKKKILPKKYGTLSRRRFNKPQINVYNFIGSTHYTIKQSIRFTKRWLVHRKISS